MTTEEGTTLLAPVLEIDPHSGAYGSVQDAKPSLLPHEQRQIEATTSSVGNSLSWFCYDAAESFWNTILNSIAFSPFAMLLGILGGWSYMRTMALMLVFVSLSNLGIAVASPFVGALTDVLGMRKWVVIVFAIGATACTVALPVFFNFYWVCSMFGLAFFCVHLCRLLYDAQVPFVFGSKKRGIVQALGGALSVVGAFGSIALSIIMKKVWGPWVTIGTDANINLSSMSSEFNPYGALRYFIWACAIGWALFVFGYVWHRERVSPRNEPVGASIRRTGVEIRVTFFDIFKDRNGICFTVSWMILISSAPCNQSMTPASMQGSVGIDAVMTDICVALSLPPLFVGAIASGFVLHRFGGRIALLWSYAFFMFSELCSVVAGWHVGGRILPWWFVFPGTMTSGFAIGIMVATGRQMITELSSPSRVAQWGGFQKICGRIGLVVNPVLYSILWFGCVKWGLSVNMSYRVINFVRIAIFLIGLVFTYNIVDPHPRYMSGERAPFEGLYEPGGRYPRHVVYKDRL